MCDIKCVDARFKTFECCNAANAYSFLCYFSTDIEKKIFGDGLFVFHDVITFFYLILMKSSGRVGVVLWGTVVDAIDLSCDNLGRSHLQNYVLWSLCPVGGAAWSRVCESIICESIQSLGMISYCSQSLAVCTINVVICELWRWVQCR